MRVPLLLVTIILCFCAHTLQAAQAAKKAPAKAAKAAPLQINITGKWETNTAGNVGLFLHQEGSRVWGRDHVGSGVFSGTWSEGRLILIYTPYLMSKQCPGRTVFLVSSKGTTTRMEGKAFELADNRVSGSFFTRLSPEPGDPFEYPYELELKTCGQLFTYDLAFETNSDQLKGTDGPILAAVADLLKKDPALKIRVAGHTDSTGDLEANKGLSTRRAESVKRLLVEKYGADSNRISTRGWGAEQPLGNNETEEGRTINRRVEILIAR